MTNTLTESVWHQVLGHDRQVHLLRRSIEQHRLAHGYLFVGPAGVGKALFAKTLAQCLLCREFSDESCEACGTCPGCKSVLAGTHPDLLSVGCPEGKRELTVDLFVGSRERRGKEGLCFDLSLRPTVADRKIALIDDADRMNDAAANALLKTLEEPPANALLILMASSLDAVLPTIRSRTQIVRFAPLRDEVVSELIRRDDPDLSVAEAQQIARLAEGSLAAAHQLKDPGLRELRITLFQQLANRHASGTDTARDLLARVEAIEKNTSAQREIASWIVRLTVEFLRAVLEKGAGLGPTETNDAGTDAINRFAEEFAPLTNEKMELIGRMIDRAVDAETHISQHVSTALVLDVLFQELFVLRP